MRCPLLVAVLLGTGAAAGCVGEGYEERLPQDASPVTCGIVKCSVGQFCYGYCTGLPFYCEAASDAGTCVPGRYFTTNCAWGPGEGGGCSDVVDHYECTNLTRNQTTAQCSGWGPVAIVDGVAYCCHD
jgi:hypothetical protein